MNSTEFSTVGKQRNKINILLSVVIKQPTDFFCIFGYYYIKQMDEKSCGFPPDMVLYIRLCHGGNNMIQKLAAYVTAHPKIIILVSILLLIPCAFGFFMTGVNYDILSYLPEDLESVTSLDILDKNFQFAASSIVILEDMPAKDVVKIKQQIEEIDCVVQVLWTDSVLDISVPVDILPDIAKDVFYSKDGNATLFIVQYSTGTSDDVTLNAIKDIRRILTKQCYISGISAAVQDVKDLVETEAILYVTLAVTVALITLAFTMETLFMPLALFFALACAVVYNMGTNFFFGEISFISQSIAAVLQLGVTMDYSIFLIDRFEEEKIKTPDDKRSAMQRAIKTSYVSLLSSSLTTVFGFLALCFMSLTIGMDLGIIMAKGVVLGIASVLIVLPAVLLQFDSILSKFRHKRLLPRFDRLSAFTLRHKKVFAILFIALLIPSFFTKDQMGLYYNIIKALPDDTPSLVALDKMKTDFDMASTHFLLLPDTTPAKNVEKMLKEIEKLDGIEDVLALNTLLGAAIDTSVLPEIVNDLCYKDGYSLAMINSAFDAGSKEANAQVDAMRYIVERYSDGGMATGEAVLMADLAKTADSDLLLTSVISVLAILILIMFAFKSLSIPVILVLAIELAIFINQTISWLMGTSVSFIAPIVISCVQLGATVDYAILMTSRYKENLAAGLHKDEAAQKASASSMRSVFQSALVFFTVTGSIALVSDITLISELCVMLARGSLISATVILFLLAPTLNMFEDFIRKTSLDWPFPDPDNKNAILLREYLSGKNSKKLPAAAAATATARTQRSKPDNMPRRAAHAQQPQNAARKQPEIQSIPSARAARRAAAQTPPMPDRQNAQPGRSPDNAPLGQGAPARTAPPMPPQGVPVRTAPPMPPQGVPVRTAPPMPPQGVPVRTTPPMPPQPAPAIPQQDIAFTRRQSTPQDVRASAPQNTIRSPYEVNPYAKKPAPGTKEDK